MDFGQIWVRFSGKIGQIVSLILENFSQILIISTLHNLPLVIIEIVTHKRTQKKENEFEIAQSAQANN